MEEILRLKQIVQKLHEPEAKKMSTEPIQYWSGGDWQSQGLEKAYATVLKEIDNILNNSD